jgi:hypothetical protein
VLKKGKEDIPQQINKASETNSINIGYMIKPLCYPEFIKYQYYFTRGSTFSVQQIR